MKRLVNLVVLLMVTLPLSRATAGSAPPPTYTITDLGTMGGTNSHARGISNAGVVTGSSDTTNDANVHAYSLEDGIFTDLGTLGGSESFAGSSSAINSRGDIVGDSDTGPVDANGNPIEHAFFWRDGQMTELFPLPGFVISHAHAVNQAGDLVFGHSDAERIFASIASGRGDPPPLVINPKAVGPNPQVAEHAVFYRNGQTIDLGPAGGFPNCIVFGANNKGQAVGPSFMIIGSPNDPTDPMRIGPAVATLWTVSANNQITRTPLPLPAGMIGSLAEDINEQGDIVGGAADPTGVFHPVLWDRRGFTTYVPILLPGPPGQANAINNVGEIAGQFFATPPPNVTVGAIAWKSTGGVYAPIILPTLGGVNSLGIAINDQGTIVGSSDLPSGDTHAAAWSPGSKRYFRR